MKVKFHADFFEESNCIVGLCPELNISSFGDNLEEAKLSLQEAVSAFLETCEELGTLAEVLEEAGFELRRGIWVSREPLSTTVLTTA